MHELFNSILEASPHRDTSQRQVLGHSREDRPIHGYRFGSGPLAISLIAGCHADEPVGPLFLGHLVSYLANLPSESPLISDLQWWIVPHINPDGEQRNKSWFDESSDTIDLEQYLRLAVREAPGDDIEFGFPRDETDAEARPENRAVYAWWNEAKQPFGMHASLHGMGFAAGPWFLIEPKWVGRIGLLKTLCKESAASLSYSLHDIDRDGEKGFSRIEEGFCTRPDSRSMADYFHKRGDETMAEKFRPSSMESVRALGGDPLTLVSEMPLFIAPELLCALDNSKRVMEEWYSEAALWRARLQRDGELDAFRQMVKVKKIKPMPLKHQMELQWRFITAGVAQVQENLSAAEQKV